MIFDAETEPALTLPMLLILPYTVISPELVIVTKFDHEIVLPLVPADAYCNRKTSVKLGLILILNAGSPELLYI